MNFEVLGEIEDIETIATGPAIRDLARLRKRFGPGRGLKTQGNCQGAARND
jgi:hypothetical protein